MFVIDKASLDDPQVQDLLRFHLAGMHATSPPDAVFALDASGLADPKVTLWGAWSDTGALAAFGALKLLGDGAAEVKSMRTHPDHLRRGAAALLLETIIAAAREHGIARLSLETGRGEAFEPALSLYRKRGFVQGGPFADYLPSDFSQFFHLPIA